VNVWTATAAYLAGVSALRIGRPRGLLIVNRRVGETVRGRSFGFCIRRQ